MASREQENLLVELSLLFGTAAGVALWWLKREPRKTTTSEEGFDVEIKTHAPPRSSVIRRVKRKARDRVDRVRDRVDESAVEVTGNAVKKLLGVVGEIHLAVDKNPWACVGGGLLAGVVIAAMLPRTATENRVLGEIRERAKESVQSYLGSNS